VAEITENYAHKDWVVERRRKDNDGNEIGRHYYVDVVEGTEGARHHDKEKRFTVSPVFVIVFIGILILNGAHFGSGSRSSRKLWQKIPYGLSIPHVWNAMTRNAYESMRHFIHFADNSLDKPIGSPGYDPLFKVRYALEAIQEGLLKVWSAGKDIAINKSTIKYMGRAIAWVQYMPAKLIKHGIKVFCVCCAVSGIMLAYKVYCGKGGKKTDGTVVSLCDNLLQKAGLTDTQGRTLYTDNYYTSMSLVKHLYNKYRWICVGTIVPTEKNELASHDLSFHKLSNGARNMIERGWYCKAAIKLRA
jgi:hypothetical protein